MTNQSIEKNLTILKLTPKLIRVLFEGLPENVVGIQGTPEHWQVFDVLGHLIYGEEDDWIARIKVILFDENKTFKPFDRFAMFEKTKDKTVTELVKRFEELRHKNLEEFTNLVKPDNLMSKGIHPSLGEVNLSQLISTWVVHDLSHISQILRIVASEYKQEVGPWIEYLRILQDNH